MDGSPAGGLRSRSRITRASPSGRGLRARESHGLATEGCHGRSSHAGPAAAAAGRHIALGEATDSKSTCLAPPRPTIRAT
jgi:hypothetical protein